MAGLRKILSSSVHPLCSVQQLRTEANGRCCSFTYRRLNRAHTTYIGTKCRIKALLLSLYSSRCSIHKNRVNYIQNSWNIMCILQLVRHRLAQAYYLKYYTLTVFLNTVRTPCLFRELSSVNITSTCATLLKWVNWVRCSLISIKCLSP